ncbi:unnamed protein product [Camellia sinensis]
MEWVKKKKALPSSASKQVFDKEGLTSSSPDKEEGLTSSSPDKEECVGMIRKIEALTRKIDLIHLLRSYQYFGFTQQLRWIRELSELKISVSNNSHVKHEEFQDVRRRINRIEAQIENKFRGVERHLVQKHSRIWAFISQEEDDIMSLDEGLTQKSVSREENLTHKTEVGLTPETSGDELLEIAIDSAVRQVSICIEGRRIRKIGISGRGGEKVASALKDVRNVISKCSVVLCISVSRHHNIEEVRQNIATQIGRLRSRRTDHTSEGSLDQYLPHNFLLLVDCIDGQIDLHDLKIPYNGFLVLTTQSQKVHEIMHLDLEIRMEDHLLPWKLFCRNVGPSLVHSSSVIQQMAARLVKECDGHLHAIVLLARALKGVADIGVWELALNQVLVKPKPNQTQPSPVMFHVLKFFWDRKDIMTKHCIKNCTHSPKWSVDSLVSYWIKDGLVETEANGKVILQELINSFLLENFDNGFVRMHEETQFVIRSFNPSHLRLGGLGLTETPEVEDWFYSEEIELMNNKLSELPEKPECSFLQKLLLHNNCDLMEIPHLFFQDMPRLTHLDLSYTSIKSLPPSISNLKSLQKFFLRGCELLMELPPNIGALENLEEFDLEETEIMYLPKEIGKLINLRSFKVSFCQHANRYKETKQMDTTIPTGVLSKLNGLRELSIDVNLDGDWWDVDVKVILNELNSLKSLSILELYLPSAELLQRLRRDLTKYLTYFRFTVGHHRQRIISRLPQEVEEIFKKKKKSMKCLEYINGDGIPTEITEVLNHANFFFLDRHWTVKMLSDFGNENMENLRVCLLVECNELQTIIDGDYKYPLGVDYVYRKPVFIYLKYLGIHYMWNLQSIWKGPIDKGCLSNLRVLALHTCPNLATVFTPNLLGNLRRLEELIVEDCCKIKSLVSQESLDLKHGYVLQSLKSISLLDLPELVSISDVTSISPKLKSLIVYNCPKLETLYVNKTPAIKYLKIKGEKEWWESLKWHESESSSSIRPTYEELGRGEDLMHELARDIYSHQQGLRYDSFMKTRRLGQSDGVKGNCCYWWL